MLWRIDYLIEVSNNNMSRVFVMMICILKIFIEYRLMVSYILYNMKMLNKIFLN